MRVERRDQLGQGIAGARFARYRYRVPGIIRAVAVRIGNVERLRRRGGDEVRDQALVGMSGHGCLGRGDVARVEIEHRQGRTLQLAETKRVLARRAGLLGQASTDGG